MPSPLKPAAEVLPQSAVPSAGPRPELVPEPPKGAPREIGGRDGPEPTRFGDWEKSGRCIDF